MYVSGHLDVSGYTVALVGFNGRYVSSRSQRFHLRAPGRRVTVQLINPRGEYAGPVVFGGSSSRVITGVKAGADLGRIDVVAAKGYAHPARRVARKRLDPARWAYARHGVPIANGKNLGLVDFKGKKNGGAGPGQDEAHLGIPNELDIAVPGRHIIKELAPAPRHARASAAFGGLARASAVHISPAIGEWTSTLIGGIGGSLDETVNADAAGVTEGEIDTAMENNLSISTVLNKMSPSPSLVELDCNGLSYCSQGGPGEALLNPWDGPVGSSQYAAFPAISRDPETGFGELVGPNVPNDGLIAPIAGGSSGFVLYPRATSSQIGSGNVITTASTIDGVTTETPQTLGFVFETTPAITSYADTAGHSRTIEYPERSGPGTEAFKVAPGPNGDIVVTLTFYRPQRPGVAGAGEAPFMDIGHLGYTLSVVTPGQTQLQPPCDPSDYSNLSPTLSITTGNTLSAGSSACVLVDSAGDQPASPGSPNTLSFTIDLTRWLAARGVSFPVATPGSPSLLWLSLAANVLNSSGGSVNDARQAFSLQTG